MKRKGIKWAWIEGVKAMFVFASCYLGMAGCYPFLPAYFAVCCRKGEVSVLVLVGALSGMLSVMSMNIVLKYIFCLAIIGIGLKLYLWSNRFVNSLITAGIAAGAVVIMNIVGNIFEVDGWRLVWLGSSEGLMVFGSTLLFYQLVKLPYEWSYRLMEGRKRKPVPWLQEKEFHKQKMESFADAVNGLADVFLAMSKPRETVELEEVSVLEQEITGKLCASCDGCAICWNESRMRRVGGIRQLLQAVIHHLPKEELLLNQYVEQCEQYEDMVEAAIQAFGRMELNHAWQNRLCENRYLIAQQLDAMASLMDEWAKSRKNLDHKLKRMMAQILYEGTEKGLIIEDLHIFEDNDHLCIESRVSSKWKGGIPVKHYVSAVEKVLKRPMRLGKESKTVLTQDATYLALYEDTQFYGLQGIATEKKFDSSVNGDSFSFFAMDDGNYHICLSDGMGSGIQANKESEMVVDLLQKFIEAGFQKETAIKLMNCTMVLQGEENRFSTLDYAMIDLYTGEMELIKIGGAATFVKRGEEVFCLEDATLPGGVDVYMELHSQKKQLRSGDFLVMLTDGVIEYLHVQNPKETMMDIIKKMDTQNAGVLADGILKEVKKYTGEKALDDMTVLVTGVWEK